MADKPKFQTVDEYIGSFPQTVQATLAAIRAKIKETVPGAEEVLSYQLPAFKYHGMLIYYSAYKEHYSLSFPPPFKVFEVFREELSPYAVSKTAVQFPMEQPFPLELMSRMVAYRAKENQEKEQKKKK